MQCRVNISIDDVSPHPRSSTAVLKQCFRVIEQFDDAKFTLFVPLSYWRTIKPGIATTNPLQIDLFPDFCKELSELPKKNFELAYHGFHHGIPNVSDNDEMRNLTKDQCIQLIEAMYKVAEMSKLEFSPVLRPPSWRMSPECFDACKEMGIEILALTSEPYGGLDYGGKDITYEDVVYYTACPPFKELDIVEKTEIVYHACDWDKNYLNKNLTDELIEILDENKENIEFCFMKGMI